MKYFAVIGRMCGDDEDSVEIMTVPDEAAAKEEFKRRMWEYTGIDDPEELAEAQENAEANGEGVFINHILTSNAPIVDV